MNRRSPSIVKKLDSDGTSHCPNPRYSCSVREKDMLRRGGGHNDEGRGISRHRRTRDSACIRSAVQEARLNFRHARGKDANAKDRWRQLQLVDGQSERRMNDVDVNH